MIEFAGRGILLDIEGTTSSVRFVYDVMFPFVRRELNDYLAAHWQAEEMDRVRELMAGDAGAPSFADWCRSQGIDHRHDSAALDLVRREVLRLMDGDVKATGLKMLQGQIWQAGFESGELRAHVYDDVPPALAAWQAAGYDLRIYSSGSTDAQRLFFGHTQRGNLLGHFSGHYDTTVGSKREAASYERIATGFALPAGEILFLSDVVAELDAARQAGLQTALCRRPENAPVQPHTHREISSFAEIRLVSCR
ncbi:MAG: acireductone synthase [Pirellulaceae bacterium]|nr:acireductone synthase [Pirellulaceae bacterium]